MGCRCNDVGILHRVVEQSCGDKTSGMCHVDHKQCSHLVGNLTHTLVIPLTAICRTTTDDKLWLVLDGKSFHLVIIHSSCLLVEVISHRAIQNSGCVDSRTMREVTAVCKVEAHECVSWLKHCEQHCSIGLCARVRLNIGIFSAEEFANSVDSKLFHLVNNAATAVVALAGITLGILVGEV